MPAEHVTASSNLESDRRDADALIIYINPQLHGMSVLHCGEYKAGQKHYPFSCSACNMMMASTATQATYCGVMSML